MATGPTCSLLQVKDSTEHIVQQFQDPKAPEEAVCVFSSVRETRENYTIPWTTGVKLDLKYISFQCTVWRIYSMNLSTVSFPAKGTQTL